MDSNSTLPVHLPPHNTEAECAVLGALMIDQGAFQKVEYLNADAFYDPRNRKVFEAITSLISKNKPFDIVTVRNQLIANKSFDEAGSVYVLEIANCVCTSTCVEEHARIVYHLYKKRQLMTIGNELLGQAFDPMVDADTITDSLLGNLCRMSSGLANNDITMPDAKKQMMNRIKKAYLGEEMGVPTGFKELDNASGGFSLGDLIIIGADTSVGKSALAWTIAVNAASSGSPIGFISLEMSPAQLFGRAVARRTQINSGRITNPTTHGERKLSDIEIGTIEYAAADIEGLPIYIADIRTVESICAKVKIWVMKFGIKGVFVDYMQILATAGTSVSETTFLTNTARRFQQLAKELNIFVCVLSQFSRPTAGESNNASLKRLRGSQEIASAADMVILVSRPEQDGTSFPKGFEEISTHGTALIDIRKGRNVGTSKFVVKFDTNTTTFSSFDGHVPLAKDDPVCNTSFISYNDVFPRQG